MTNGQRSNGFGTIGVIVVVAVVACVGLGGWYVYHRNHNKDKNSTTHTQTTNTNGDSSQTPPQQTATYLTIKELGIRVTLTNPIKDAYYKVKDGVTKNGKPVIALYLHSWDAYPNCAPDKNGDGIAEVLTFAPGASDPVNGDMATAYPDAPLINGSHYYIATEQSDCTNGTVTTSPVYDAFKTAYKTIEAE